MLTHIVTVVLLTVKWGEHDKAISDLTRAIEIKPDYAGAYNNRGVAYDRKGGHMIKRLLIITRQ